MGGICAEHILPDPRFIVESVIYDNGVTDSFFHTLKTESVDFEWLNSVNHQRKARDRTKEGKSKKRRW